jgi:hypothetical protein
MTPRLVACSFLLLGACKIVPCDPGKELWLGSCRPIPSAAGSGGSGVDSGQADEPVMPEPDAGDAGP